MADNSGTLTAEDLGLLDDRSGDSDVPAFLQSDALTAEEEAFLEESAASDNDDGGPESEPEGGAAVEHEADGAADADPALAEGEAGAEAGNETGEDLGEDAEAGAAQGEKRSMVEHGAFHKEREQRKALQAELAAYKEREARFDERAKVLAEQRAAREEEAKAAAAAAKESEEPDVPPNPEEDIFGFAQWQARELERVKSELKKTTAAVVEDRQTFAATREESQVIDTFKNAAVQFAQEAPDFGNAYQHLVQSRDRELTRLGYADANQRREIIQSEELEIVKDTLARGENPAQLFYDFAKDRGYTPPAADPASDDPAQNGADPGEQPARRASGTSPAAVDGSAEMARIAAAKKKQNAGKSLSNAGGQDSQGLTMAAIADMSDKEFDALYTENPDLVERVLGG